MLLLLLISSTKNHIYLLRTQSSICISKNEMLLLQQNELNFNIWYIILLKWNTYGYSLQHFPSKTHVSFNRNICKCLTFICLTTVDFPDSPVPKSNTRTWWFVSGTSFLTDWSISIDFLSSGLTLIRKVGRWKENLY